MGIAKMYAINFIENFTQHKIYTNTYITDHCRHCLSFYLTKTCN